ncbi:DJ-1/PfpI family protein [Paenibacillus sp. SC116]|uniref:DJ-1/PfpI family protein n=1 Tax=Paenibacillus sp. SC116 TaxID=2968986 RepID=UPI00215B7530|nr:DJ-1/PfpI family protein [Paenibacillus sp. SC116]MCR8842738.1 DJ-1/PfpI family protein [Paenibacillus sp. SC116]
MKKVLLLLADGFEAVEASVFTDVFGWNKWEGDESTELITVGLRKQIKSTWNFTIIAEQVVSEIDLEHFDALAIPGGFEEAGFYDDAYDERFLDVIRHFDANQKPIACICVASLTLGKSGILQNRRATTYSHPSSHRIDQLKSFGANVQNSPIVQDGHIITSSNPATGFDVAFLLLESLTSVENTKRIKELMGFNN